MTSSRVSEAGSRAAGAAVDPTGEGAFAQAVAPYRRELLAHCYRMVACIHEAEDLVQETLVRAWAAQDRFEGRASMRTWLYRIATNACLDFLRADHRRPLPAGLGAPTDDPNGELRLAEEVSWLEPMPDALVGTPPPDPAGQAVLRDDIRLAFVAALQHLTAQQRAVLLLRDVFEMPAAEVAQTLSMSVAGVHSTLQRARAHVQRWVAPGGAAAELEIDDPRTAALLQRYVAAFEAYDVSAIVAQLTEDVVWEMPPFLAWFQGAATIGALIGSQCPADGPGSMRVRRAPTPGNGAPILGMYLRGPDGVHRAFQLQHLRVTAAGVAHVVIFFDTTLFARFGLPEVLPPDPLAPETPPDVRPPDTPPGIDATS